MEEYWKIRPRAEPSTPTAAHGGSHVTKGASITSEFDRHRLSLLTEDEEGWAAELRRYLKDMPADVTKDTDVIKWWQVSLPLLSYSFTMP
jgi:hypothetical protein